MYSQVFRLIIFGLLLHSPLFGQNLAPNPDFEYYEVCPSGPHIFGGPLECVPWAAATPGMFGSSDYFNACCSCPVSVPGNVVGFQYARSGEGYTGMFTGTSTWREYIMAPLTEPLQAGVSYYVEFWVSPADDFCSIKPMGALFTIGPPIPNGTGPLPYIPQIEVNENYLNDYDDWTPVYGCFIAEGGENYITIGNFRDQENSPLDPDCPVPPPQGNGAYYYVDDVSVEASPIDEIDFDFGGPVSACYEYEIDPGIIDVFYHWEDGSDEPTLIVNESGVYSVTITDKCSSVIDSLEVEILGGPNVDIPEDQVTICSPAVYEIELDPDAGSYSWSNGTIGPNITIDETGIYEVVFDNGCEISTDQIEVIINSAPAPISLGNDFILCPNELFSFTFDPSLGDFTWQDGSHESTYFIDDPGLYELTISNSCGEESDEVEVVAGEIPTVELGQHDLFICGGESLFFELDPEAGNYVWQDGSISSNYMINVPGLYSVILTNTCGQAFDTVNVQSELLPVPDLGADTLICQGQSIVLNSSIDSAVYLWQDQSTSATYTVTQSGIYSVIVTNACGTGADSIVVEVIVALDSLELGNDLSICPGESIVLDPGIENANYLWQDFSTADTFLISKSGQYSVTVSNQCTSYSDTVNVIVQNDPPNVDLIDQVSLCEGSTITLAAGISGVNYLWSDGSSLSELQINSPGSYSLTVSNACGVDADTVIVIDGGPTPVVSLGNDISFCAGNEVLLTPANQNVNSWLWSDGSTTPTFFVSQSGVITVEVTNACGTASDTLVATLLEPTPTFNLGVDTSICPGESLILQADIAGTSLVWSDGTQGEQIVVTGNGVFHATLSGVCGSTTDTIQVSVLQPAPVLDLGADQSLCPGETITIDPGIADVFYEWHDGSNEEIFSTNQPGQIILIVSNNCGQDIDTLLIVENTEGPQVDLGADVMGCEGDTVSLQPGISGVDYLWQDGSTNPKIDVVISGEYILQVSNNCGADVDTVIIDLSGQVPLASLGPDTLLCEGEKLVLTSDIQAGTIISWQDESSLPQFEVVEAGLYILEVSNHCGSDIDSVTVTYQDGPIDFDLGKDTVLCPGESIVLFAPITTDQLTWQDGSEENTLIAIAGKLYSLTISNDCGTLSDEILVSADNSIPVVALDDEYPICPEEILTLDVTQSFAATYLWNTGSTQPFIEINQPGEYAVTIFAPCQDVTEDVVIVVGEDCLPRDIFIPNIFSPNGDGINDVFEVNLHPKLQVHSLHGIIYDRWGNVLYESTGQTFSWNGNFDQRPMMPGVYVFRMEIEYIINGKEEKEIRVGDISLIR